MYCLIDDARDASTATRPVSFIKSSSVFEVKSEFVDSDIVGRRRDPSGTIQLFVLVNLFVKPVHVLLPYGLYGCLTVKTYCSRHYTRYSKFSAVVNILLRLWCVTA